MRPLQAGQWARWIPEAWLRPPRAFPFFGVQLDPRPTLDFRMTVFRALVDSVEPGTDTFVARLLYLQS